MKRILIVVLMAALGFYILGCGRSDQSAEQMQEPMSLESLGTISTEPGEALDDFEDTASVEVIEVAGGVEVELTPIPGPPYNPSKKEIQLALQNAGFYEGEIDGKIGPVSKRAIEEFQKVNGLKVDGKVGPQTWGALEKYLFIESSLDIIED